MTLAERLKKLRIELGLSQEAFGAQGFVSAPGWIKIEYGQRSPSEKLINALVEWLVRARHVPAKNALPLIGELVTLKYLGAPSAFVQMAVRAYAASSASGKRLVADYDAATAGPRAGGKRGRPKGAVYKKRAASAAAVLAGGAR